MSEVIKRRLPFCDGYLFDKIKKFKEGTLKEIKTTSRSSTILPHMVGATISIHNGKSYVPVLITEGMIGFKLGAFVFTRTFKSHGGDKDTARAAAVKKTGGKKK